MHALMYGRWERWCSTRFARLGTAVTEGIAGSNVIMTRSALDKVGMWDERIRAADFDLVIRTNLRSEQQGDIRPVHCAVGLYFHHFIRLTYKKKFPPFVDTKKLIPLHEKWDSEEVGPLPAAGGMRMRRSAHRRQTRLTN